MVIFLISSLIDISEVRLKLSLETEPAQRPHGVLGVWSPVLSAVGNALKMQVRLLDRIDGYYCSYSMFLKR